MMKFVHLAPQPAISRILKNGIRTGDGLRGRGIYAVPLAMFERFCVGSEDQLISCGPGTSIIIWKWLSRRCRSQRHMSAVIFGTAEDHWPADLCVEVGPHLGTDWIPGLISTGVDICPDRMQSVRDHVSWGCLADLHTVVGNVTALGLTLNKIQRAGFRVASSFSDTVEIVFPSPVKPSLVHRIVPLCRTNLQFKACRRRERTMRVDSE
jgi:hypothetical protein